MAPQRRLIKRRIHTLPAHRATSTAHVPPEVAPKPQNHPRLCCGCITIFSRQSLGAHHLNICRVHGGRQRWHSLLHIILCCGRAYIMLLLLCCQICRRSACPPQCPPGCAIGHGMNKVRATISGAQPARELAHLALGTAALLSSWQRGWTLGVALTEPGEAARAHAQKSHGVHTPALLLPRLRVRASPGLMQLGSLECVRWAPMLAFGRVLRCKALVP